MITASAPSGAEAVRLADAAANAYRTETKKDVQRLTDAAVASIDQSATNVRNSATGAAAQGSASSTLSQLAVNASDIRTSSALFGDGVDYVIAPHADAVTEASLPIKELGVGFILGLVIAATVAWLRANPRRHPCMTRTRTRTPSKRIFRSIRALAWVRSPALAGRRRRPRGSWERAPEQRHGADVRVALVGTRGAPARYGGFETCVEEVGARLADAGHQVVVYCRDRDDSASRGVRRIGA